VNQPLLGDNAPLDSNNPLTFIGVLDIFRKSKEQICINYTNEKLHAQFNQHMFKEGVLRETIKFVNNQDYIDLIKASRGILMMLDKERKVHRGGDKTLLEKLVQKYGNHARFKQTPKMQMIAFVAIRNY